MNSPLAWERHSRRTVLRAAGAAVAVPVLQPTTSRAANPTPPRRLVAIHVPLGMMPQFFFPKEDAASGVPSSPYLDFLTPVGGRFTAFFGLSHPNVDGNHHAGQCFLTAAPHPGQPTFRNSISLDQFAAAHVGRETRFPFLALSVRRSDEYPDTLSVSRAGVGIPAQGSPKRLYRSMFVAGTADERSAIMRQIEAGGSILDLLRDKATSLRRDGSAEDRGKLDQYFFSIRELETRLANTAAWEQRPKPQVDDREPHDIADANRVIEKSRLMFDMIRLALQTDSTRVITLSLSTFSVVPHVPGVQNETHGLTHHGNQPEKIAELKKIEEAQMGAFAAFLDSLQQVREGEGSLLDHTQILYGSCLGNANSHSNRNLPIILAGGGYRHPGYLAFNQERNTPLANLFLTMLQRLGIPAETFASSTGTLQGLGV